MGESDSLLPDVKTVVFQAFQASSQLAVSRPLNRSQALHRMAKALHEDQDDILEANTLDLEASQDTDLEPLLKTWLRLTPERLQRAVDILHRLGDRPDPMQQVLRASFQTEYSQSYNQMLPLGVIALIYEALPELGAIAAGLCIRAGNSLVLKGSSEAAQTNQAIVQCLTRALEDSDLPSNCLVNLPGGYHTIPQLVMQDQWIDLVIPYGRPALVQQVVRQATTPVLRTTMGNCYLYWAASGKLDTVRWMVLDSHAGEPDAVNAIEKVLVCRDLKETSLQLLFDSLRDRGLRLKGDEELCGQFEELEPVQTDEWSQPLLDRCVCFRSISGLEEAVHWINHHSSGHADGIATESYAESRAFSSGLNSATVHINSSPRFTRFSRLSNEVSLGMSNQKGYRRGRIGVDCLTTVKQIVLGGGEPH
jgi:glutamate-5-semialdehyde dehydrogenase